MAYDKASFSFARILFLRDAANVLALTTTELNRKDCQIGTFLGPGHPTLLALFGNVYWLRREKKRSSVSL